MVDIEKWADEFVFLYRAIERAPVSREVKDIALPALQEQALLLVYDTIAWMDDRDIPDQDVAALGRKATSALKKSMDSRKEADLARRGLVDGD